VAQGGTRPGARRVVGTAALLLLSPALIFGIGRFRGSS
jgi:hypothetical protein